MPFINKREATKRSKDRKINGKLTNGTNRRSRVWPVYFIYHLLCFCLDFCVTVVNFVFLFGCSVSVVTFVSELWVLCFCFDFCVSVVGFVFLF